MEKKLLVVLVVVGLCSTVALAFDPMGPPVAGLGKGKASLGVEYIWNSMEIKRHVETGSYADHAERIEPMNKVYANLGYGLADNVDVFVRAGAGWADWTIHANYDWDMSGDCSFIYGGGFKATLAEQPGVKWGALAQYSWGQFSGDADITREDAPKGNYDLTLDELQIAFGPAWTAAQGLVIYGGPFINTVRGYDVLDWKARGKHRHPISEENWFGGYVGVGLELAQNCSLNAEWMQTADDMAAAVGLVFKQ